MNRKNQKNKNLIIGGRKFKKKTFMNESKLKQLIFILVVTIVLLFTTLAIVLTNHRVKPKQPETKIIVITDTLTNIVYDTVYLERYKTVKLQLTDTIVIDSVKIDSVFVQVPISIYKLDTVFQTDTTRLDLHIQNSGYEVKFDSLYYRLEYSPTPLKLKKKRHRFGFYIGPAVGVGYDYLNNKPVPTVGIGIGIGWSMKKY